MPVFTPPQKILGDDIERNAQAFVRLAQFAESKDVPTTYYEAAAFILDVFSVPQHLGNTVALNGIYPDGKTPIAEDDPTTKVKELYYRDETVEFASVSYTDTTVGTGVVALKATRTKRGSWLRPSSHTYVGAVLHITEPEKNLIRRDTQAFQPYHSSSEYRKKLLAENATDIILSGEDGTLTAQAANYDDVLQAEPVHSRMYVETLRDFAGIAVMVHKALQGRKRELYHARYA